MAEIIVKFTMDGTQGNVTMETMDKNMKQFTQTLGASGSSLNNFENQFVNAFRNMRNVGQGFTEIMNLLESTFGKGVSKAMAYELALAKLKGVMESGGKTAGTSIEQMEKLASQFSANTMFSKEEILNVERYFMTFKNIGGASIEGATDAALGLAEALDLDARGATIALAKLLDQGAEGAKAAKKLGVAFTDEEIKHMGMLESLGQTSEMQTYIIDLLASKHRELGEAIRGTSAFEMNQAEKVFESFEREGGSVLLKGIYPMIKGFADLASSLNTLPGPVKSILSLVVESGIAYGVLATTGIGTWVKNLLQLDFGMQAHRIQLLQTKIDTETLTMAEYNETKAAITAEAATKTLWLGMGPMGWVITGITALVTAWSLLRSNISYSNEEMADGTKDIAKQKNEFDSLAAKIKDVSASLDDRNKAVKEMQEKYPDYLKNKNIDLNNEKEMNSAIEEGNRLFDERIKLKGMENQLQKISDDMAIKRIELLSLQEQQKTASDQPTQVTTKGAGTISKKSGKQFFQELIDAKKEELSEQQKEFDRVSNAIHPAKEDNKNPEQKAEELLKTVTKGYTNDQLEKFVQELKVADGHLEAGSKLSAKVKEHIKQLSDGSRFGKTGGDTLKYLNEDAKIDLENVESMTKIVEVIEDKWKKIPEIKVSDKKGLPDEKATKEKQQKARYDLRRDFENTMDKQINVSTKEAEIEAGAAGSSKVEQLEAKLARMKEIVAQAKKISADWNAEHKDFPILSKMKEKELGLEVTKTQNEINKELFDSGAKDIDRQTAQWDKFLESEKASDLERFAWKKVAFEAKLKLAEENGQKEQQFELKNQLALLDIDEKMLREKIARHQRDAGFDLEASKAGRAGAAGSEKDQKKAEDIAESKRYADELDRITDDTILTDDEKKKSREEAEAVHQKNLFDIKKKYYDSWLGELAGLSQKEIATIDKMMQEIIGGVSQLYQMQVQRGKDDADAYKKSQTDKLDTDKKAELAKARTEKQKQDIEDKYQKKKDALDDEATKRGQERIKTMFAVQKALSIANAMIKTYEGATEAFANVVTYPPPLNAILSGAIIASGLANIAVISQQEMPKFAGGGLFRGKGNGTDDQNTVQLSDYEFIMRSDITRKHLALLQLINGGILDSTRMNDFSNAGRYGAPIIVNAGASEKIMHEGFDNVAGRITDMHQSLATGGIHAKVTRQVAADITRAGLAKMKVHKA